MINTTCTYTCLVPYSLAYQTKKSVHMHKRETTRVRCVVIFYPSISIEQGVMHRGSAQHVFRYTRRQASQAVSSTHAGKLVQPAVMLARIQYVIEQRHNGDSTPDKHDQRKVPSQKVKSNLHNTIHYTCGVKI